MGLNEGIKVGDELWEFLNWRSTSRKGNDVHMLTAIELETNTVMSKGRAFEGSSGAHNMCLVGPETMQVLNDRWKPKDGFIAYAVGGQYRDLADKRGLHANWHLPV